MSVSSALREPVLDELGILQPVGKLTLISAYRRLNDFAIKQLATGGNVVIVVDGAGAL